MKYSLLFGCVLACTGCQAEQVSPVAPSSTSPAGPTVIVAPPQQTPTPAPLPTPAPQPQPTPPPVSTTFLNISRADRIGGTVTAQEWRFSTEASPDVTITGWDFGDGAGSSRGTRAEQHIYRGTRGTSQSYQVRVTGTSGSHDIQATSLITIRFEDP